MRQASACLQLNRGGLIMGNILAWHPVERR
jgi:hypothetical protein